VFRYYSLGGDSAMPDGLGLYAGFPHAFLVFLFLKNIYMNLKILELRLVK